MNKECPVCKKSFHVKKSHFEKRVFCSRQCMTEDYRVRYSGNNNPNYKGRDTEFLKCIICGTDFQPADVCRKTAKVCSNKCKGQAISRAMTGVPKSKEQVLRALQTKKLKHIPNPKLMCTCGKPKCSKSEKCKECAKIVYEFSCLYCNKANATNIKRRKYCNRKCLSSAKRTFYSGQNNPHWKNGRTPLNQRQRRHIDYQNWRKSVFERDNYTCNDCGQIGGTLHAHHIKSYSNHPELRIDINNGKTLCASCHEKEHPGKKFKRLSKPLNQMVF